MRWVEAKEAVACIRPGHRVFVHGGAATPHTLLDALYQRKEELKEVELIHIHLEGHLPHTEKDFGRSFHAANLFVGKNLRNHINCKENDYLPIFLSQIPSLFRSGKRRPHVALIHVSRPGPSGQYSLGTSCDAAKAAVETADMVIAQINPHMPFVYGDGCLTDDEIDLAVEVDTPLYQSQELILSEEETAIGKHVASLIEDGATLQIGIGAIPNAVMHALSSHKDLGIHTEIWTDTLLPLIEKGVVTNRHKVVHPHKIVSTFLIGRQGLYHFIRNNPEVINLEVSFTNDPFVIAKNPKVTAINSAVEIDLTGQVCADSIGTKIISGVGGQVDFMFGASLSKGGRSIIAMQSMTEKNISKIVNTLKIGSGVVSTRAHVHYVVTEHGIADLQGKTLSERARSLIDIAHPSVRQELHEQWQKRYL